MPHHSGIQMDYYRNSLGTTDRLRAATSQRVQPNHSRLWFWQMNTPPWHKKSSHPNQMFAFIVSDLNCALLLRGIRAKHCNMRPGCFASTDAVMKHDEAITSREPLVFCWHDRHGHTTNNSYVSSGLSASRFLKFGKLSKCSGWDAVVQSYQLINLQSCSCHALPRAYAATLSHLPALIPPTSQMMTSLRLMGLWLRTSITMSASLVTAH